MQYRANLGKNTKKYITFFCADKKKIKSKKRIAKNKTSKTKFFDSARFMSNSFSFVNSLANGFYKDTCKDCKNKCSDCKYMHEKKKKKQKQKNPSK